MPQFKFDGMNCGSKHEDKAPKLQIHMSQLTTKYIFIYIYIKGQITLTGKTHKPTDHQVTFIQAILNFFQIATRLTETARKPKHRKERQQLAPVQVRV